jgi:hypothetical protein
MVVLASADVLAAPGQSWILPIHHREGGGWTEYSGAGYGGTSAWQGADADPTRRIFWELGGAGVPSSIELYAIEFWVPTLGPGMWQPIESQFHGVNGEDWPIETDIPWVGSGGSNHQYIGSDFAAGDAGAWKGTGPGPHTPESEFYNAGSNGTYMWLTEGSWLYAKWDFPFRIDRSWSALRVTQVTPEPTTLALLALGMLIPLRRRRECHVGRRRSIARRA